jgi:hydrogenase maturation protease
MGRTLVAGIGNIFLGDDGFGVEVARRLRDEPLGDDVDVADFGIRGVHLAYELADGRYDSAILVDAVARGGVPGTLYAIEPELEGIGGESTPADAHSLTPDAVLAWVRRVGALPARIVVVGCEPATVAESVGLSPAVAGSIDSAIRLVREIVVGSTLNARVSTLNTQSGNEP